jgi:hypothetical protein
VSRERRPDEDARLVNGDLAIGTNGAYLLYSGASRIKQDLTLALTEEYGTDRFHPTYGSIVQGYLGQVLSAELMQLVRAEVNRVLQNYLIIQQNEVLRTRWSTWPTATTPPTLCRRWTRSRPARCSTRSTCPRP